MDKKGRLIVIEGVDGCGKSTQTQLLINRLESKGESYKFIHFPILEKGVYGKLIAQFLRGEIGSIENVHPKLVALMYACERKEHVQTLQEWLNKGYTIIADRYVCSNIAYQCAKFHNEEAKKELRDWILNLEFNINSLPYPDKILFLDLPKKFIPKAMISERKGSERNYLEGAEDIHEADDTFQQKVYEEYTYLANTMKNFTKIKCYSNKAILSIQDIHALICHELK